MFAAAIALLLVIVIIDLLLVLEKEAKRAGMLPSQASGRDDQR